MRLTECHLHKRSIDVNISAFGWATNASICLRRNEDESEYSEEEEEDNDEEEDKEEEEEEEEEGEREERREESSINPEAKSLRMEGDRPYLALQ